MPFSNHPLEKYSAEAYQTATVVASSERNRTNCNIYYLIASFLILIFMVAGCSGESDTEVNTTEPPGIRYEIARYSQHVAEPTPINYTDLGHWPPTSGHHWPMWAKC